MSEFITTRAAQLKKNADKNLVSVLYSTAKKKEKLNERPESGKPIIHDKFDSKQPSTIREKSEQEKEMKRLRWDVMKFASSNLQGMKKHQANVELAISLGAEPPKKRRKNYKVLKERKQQEKQTVGEQQVQSGFLGSLKKPRTKTKKKKDTGLLGVYGKVHKK